MLLFFWGKKKSPFSFLVTHFSSESSPVYYFLINEFPKHSFAGYQQTKSHICIFRHSYREIRNRSEFRWVVMSFWTLSWGIFILGDSEYLNFFQQFRYFLYLSQRILLEATVLCSFQQTTDYDSKQKNVSYILTTVFIFMSITSL